jgi:hypothetical protein
VASSLLSRAGRWLQCTAVTCLATLLVACGGSGSAPEAYDAGSPEKQPWRTLFAAGADTRSLTGTGCTVTVGRLPLEGASTVTFTLTLGLTGLTISAAVGTDTLIQASFDPSVTNTSAKLYGLSVPGGTGTLVSLAAFDLESSAFFSLSPALPDATQQQVVFAYVQDRVTTNIRCDSLVNPLTKASLNNFVPQQRIASFLAGTPTTTVSSLDIAPEGCTFPGGSGGTYTYAVSPQGQIQIDSAVLQTDWLNTLATSPNAYTELLIWRNDAYAAGVAVNPDAQGRGFSLNRLSAEGASEFRHACGSGELGFIGGFFGGPV